MISLRKYASVFTKRSQFFKSQQTRGNVENLRHSIFLKSDVTLQKHYISVNSVCKEVV